MSVSKELTKHVFEVQLWFVIEHLRSRFYGGGEILPDEVDDDAVIDDLVDDMNYGEYNANADAAVLSTTLDYAASLEVEIDPELKDLVKKYTTAIYEVD